MIDLSFFGIIKALVKKKRGCEMIKKIISFALVSVMLLLCFVGCSDDGVPDDMFSVTLEGEPFILYVPDGWTDNRDSGISSAYYSLSDAVTVSARYFTPAPAEGESFSLDAYVEECKAAYNEKYQSFKLVDQKASALGTNNAIRLEFTFERVVEANGVSDTATITAIQYYALHGADVITLNLYCRTSVYMENDEYAEMFGQIVSEFVFCDKQTPTDNVTDKNMPDEGLKRASFDGCEYRFYVPTSWVCNMSDKMTEAYYPESGRPNVNVTSFYSDDINTPEDYFALCESEYKKDISGYELLTTAERTVDGIRAVSYTYKALYGTAEYRIMQTVFVYNELAYSITYTALGEECFSEHLADVELMMNYFSFR